MKFIKENKIALACIGFVLVAIISYLTIKENKETKENVDKIFSIVGYKNYADLTISDYPDQYELDVLMKKCYKKSYFREVAFNRIKEYLDGKKYINFMNIMILLGKYEVYDDEIQNVFTNFIKNFKYDLLEEKDLIEFIADYSSLNKYRTDELDNIIINIIKNNCDKLIFEDGKGGYYDSLKEKYKSSSKTVNPLDKYDTSSHVGTYAESELFEYYGDILVKRYKKTWYGSSAADSNNSDTTSYYLKGKGIISYVKVEDFKWENLLIILKDSENYILGDYIINIKENYINVLGPNALSYKGCLEYRELMI